jgi:hypothetical protein
MPVFSFFFCRLSVAEPTHRDESPEVLKAPGIVLEFAIYLEDSDSPVLTCRGSQRREIGVRGRPCNSKSGNAQTNCNSLAEPRILSNHDERTGCPL